MSMKKVLFIVAVLCAAAFALAACAGPAGPVGPAGPAGPVGPQGPAGTSPAAADLTCTQCHNDTTLISGMEQSYSTSVHATGTAFAIAENRSGCTGCHDGGDFSARIAAGVTDPSKYTTVSANPTRVDCRTCHQIHTTYTKADFALETTAPVSMFIFTAAPVTFDGGMGNLCANCHQPRTLDSAAAADGTIKVPSPYWGPMAPQAAMLIGVGGSSDVTGTPAAHFTMVKDTCVGCHMGGAGPNANHTFTPNVATCVTCHADAKNFDVNGVQTAVEAKMATLQAALVKAKLLDAKSDSPVVGTYPAAQANALWNYILVKEDNSMGVHNSKYINALLDASIAAFGK